MKTFYLLLLLAATGFGSSLFLTSLHSYYLISLYLMGLGVLLLFLIRLSKKLRQNATRKQQEKLFQEFMRSHTLKRY